MKQIRISDATMKQSSEGFQLSFKEKIEIAKLLDRLGADVIELEGIKNPRIDSLQIKSIAAAVNESCIAVPVELSSKESIEKTWAALKGAKHKRLQVSAATSSVQIEYISHKKPEGQLEAIRETVAACRALCPEVEFIAEDATRSDPEFLTAAIGAAIEAGATVVTLCDTAGTMLPMEFSDFVKKQLDLQPALSGVTLGVCCSDAIAMAAASSVAAAAVGAAQLCVAAYPIEFAALTSVVRALSAKADTLGAFCGVKVNQLGRIIEKINWTCQGGKGKTTPVDAEQGESGIFLTSHDDLASVISAVHKLGYELSEEDGARVYAAFKQIADRKEKVGLKELDAIIASSAMQVPETYKLDTYVITSGNTISATAHIKLIKDDAPVEGVYIGDGSIDAAFQAIEKITGCHYELDDFQLQAVTEGREAMGQTVVKLRAGGKVYSGRGISTDIVGAGIRAYLSALNKIIYEEET